MYLNGAYRSYSTYIKIKVCISFKAKKTSFFCKISKKVVYDDSILYMIRSLLKSVQISKFKVETICVQKFNLVADSSEELEGRHICPSHKISCQKIPLK